MMHAIFYPIADRVFPTTRYWITINGERWTEIRPWQQWFRKIRAGGMNTSKLNTRKGYRNRFIAFRAYDAVQLSDFD
jgi:hypothetical protein